MVESELTLEFFQEGQAETLKAAVHVALLATAALCFSYNAVAWALRREEHLASNIMVYGLLTAYEAEQIRRHRRRE